MTRLVGAIVILGAVGGFSVGSAEAQLVELEPPRTRFAGGVGVDLGVPVGEFQDFIDFGGGLGGFFLANFDRAGSVGLRVDGRVIIYGHETVHRPFSETIRRVTVDVTTSNFFVSFGAGPQWTPATGRVRPYLFGTVGFSYFATESSVSGDDDFLPPFVRSTNFDDVTYALTGGGGLAIRLSSGHVPVSLDLGAEYLQHGETQYLREGGIEELPDGTVLISPIQSNTNMMLFKIGVAFGFR
jgi:hypothetical protein